MHYRHFIHNHVGAAAILLLLTAIPAASAGQAPEASAAELLQPVVRAYRSTMAAMADFHNSIQHMKSSNAPDFFWRKGSSDSLIIRISTTLNKEAPANCADILASLATVSTSRTTSRRTARRPAPAAIEAVVGDWAAARSSLQQIATTTEDGELRAIFPGMKIVGPGDTISVLYNERTYTWTIEQVKERETVMQRLNVVASP